MIQLITSSTILRLAPLTQSSFTTAMRPLMADIISADLPSYQTTQKKKYHVAVTQILVPIAYIHSFMNTLLTDKNIKPGHQINPNKLVDTIRLTTNTYIQIQTYIRTSMHTYILCWTY